MSDKNETVMINLNLSLDQVNIIMQALGNAPYAAGRIRIAYPNGFLQASGANTLFCAYLPTPLNPATQAVTDVLDMEPLYYETLLQAAAQMALSDSQETQLAR